MMSSSPPILSHSLATAAQALEALQKTEPGDTGTGPFPSLLALRKAHLRLLLRAKDTKQAPTTAEINAFLDRVTATGARLDSPDDREAAQFILDHWTAREYTAHVPYSSLDGMKQQAAPAVSTRRLEKFDSGSIGDVFVAAETEVKKLTSDEVEAVRRILLRLVRLSADGSTFVPEPVRATDLEFGDRARVDKALAVLESAGVIVQSPETAERTFALQFEPITRVWPRYARWLERRWRFRAQVQIWLASGRNPSTLIDGELLDEAHAYHDLTESEREFLRGGLERERHRRRIGHVWLAVVVALCIIAIVGWIRASYKTSLAQEQAENAEKEAANARIQERKALDAREELRRAKNLELAQRNVDHAKRQMLASLVGIVRALARIGAAETPEYRRLNLQRWTALVKEFESLRADYLKAVTRWREAAGEGATNSDDALLGELRKVVSQLGQIQLDESDNSSLRDASRRALQLSQTIKNAFIRSNDEMALAFLETVRIDTYDLVRRHVTQIVDRVDGGDVQSAVPFIREFWVLYWGEMGIVEGRRVVSAMISFGKLLEELRERIDSGRPDKGKDKSQKKGDVAPGSIEYWVKTDKEIRQNRNSPFVQALQKVPLKDDLPAKLKQARDELFSALDAELKDKLRAEDVSLQNY